MNYWEAKDYTERYFVQFVDIKGSSWRISIQDPSFIGTASELIGSDEPFEFEGDDVEDQTECLLGTTGTLRLIVTEKTKAAFADGALYPEEVNDRRVVATCDSQVVWQGFIEVNTYDQPYDAAPYEMELNVKSWLSVLKDMPLPPYNRIEESTYDEGLGVACVADFLRYMVKYTGANYTTLYTNRAEYHDMNGYTQTTSSGNTAHWTQGFMLMAGFYSVSDGEAKQKTFGEALETILYPYGHIREQGNTLGVYLDDKDGKHCYKLDLVNADTNELTYDSPIKTYELDDIEAADTDTKQSEIAAPASVSYKRDMEGSNDILSIEGSMIRNIAATRGKTPDVWEHPGTKEEDTYNILYTSYTADEVKTGAFSSLTLNNSTFTKLLKVAYKGPGRTSTVLDLGLKLEPSGSVVLSPILPLYTRSGYNYVKFKATIYADGVESEDNSDIRLYIKDKTTGKYYYRKWIETEMYYRWGWYTDKSFVTASTFEYFNVEHDDGKPHFIEFEVVNNNSASSFEVELELSYIPASEYDYDTNYFQPMNYIADSILSNEYVQNVGGKGDEIEVEFKTMCGSYFSGKNGYATCPYNSVCDTIGQIITTKRHKISFESCYVCVANDYAAMLKNYYRITEKKKDDSIVTYTPGAIGMKARNATIKMNLISI